MITADRPTRTSGPTATASAIRTHAARRRRRQPDAPARRERRHRRAHPAPQRAILDGDPPPAAASRSRPARATPVIGAQTMSATPAISPHDGHVVGMAHQPIRTARHQRRPRRHQHAEGPARAERRDRPRLEGLGGAEDAEPGGQHRSAAPGPVSAPSTPIATNAERIGPLHRRVDVVGGLHRAARAQQRARCGADRRFAGQPRRARRATASPRRCSRDGHAASSGARRRRARRRRSRPSPRTARGQRARRRAPRRAARRLPTSAAHGAVEAPLRARTPARRRRGQDARRGVGAASRPHEHGVGDVGGDLGAGQRQADAVAGHRIDEARRRRRPAAGRARRRRARPSPSGRARRASRRARRRAEPRRESRIAAAPPQDRRRRRRASRRGPRRTGTTRQTLARPDGIGAMPR